MYSSDDSSDSDSGTSFKRGKKSKHNSDDDKRPVESDRNKREARKFSPRPSQRERRHEDIDRRGRRDDDRRKSDESRRRERDRSNERKNSGRSIERGRHERYPRDDRNRNDRDLKRHDDRDRRRFDDNKRKSDVHVEKKKVEPEKVQKVQSPQKRSKSRDRSIKRRSKTPERVHKKEEKIKRTSNDSTKHSNVEKPRNKSSEVDAYGPALPPPSKIPKEASKPIKERGPIEPVLPSKDFKPTESMEISSGEDDDDLMIGPLPISDASALSEHDLEREKRKIELKLKQLDRRAQELGKDRKEREEWMLELPEVRKVADLGLGPRQFRRGEQPDFSDRDQWTKAPNDHNDSSKDKDKRSDDKNHKREVEKRRREDAISKRDAEQEEMANKHKKSHKRDKSLLELHEKKLKKEKKKAKDEKKEERRPFNRELDLQVNKFDESRKKAAIKSSQLLDDRFGRGHAKYL